jgi:hypothetical protein
MYRRHWATWASESEVSPESKESASSEGSAVRSKSPTSWTPARRAGGREARLASACRPFRPRCGRGVGGWVGEGWVVDEAYEANEKGKKYLVFYFAGFFF